MKTLRETLGDDLKSDGPSRIAPNSARHTGRESPGFLRRSCPSAAGPVLSGATEGAEGCDRQMKRGPTNIFKFRA